MIIVLSLIVALGTVGFILLPLFRPRTDGLSETDEDLQDLLTERDNLLSAIRGLESDHLAGKLSQEDYESLRAQYEHEAIQVLHELDARQQSAHSSKARPSDIQQTETAATDVEGEDPVEAEIQKYLRERRNRGQGRTLGILLGALLLLTGLLTGAAHAQGLAAQKIERMRVAIWPEYDDPRVFVTYRGKLESTAIPPAEVHFLVPQGTEVTHTCGLTPSGEHQCRLAQFSPQGDYTQVSYQVPTNEFLIEMYYDPFTGGQVRDFTFPFQATYSIPELTIEVQKPLRSTSFQVQPAALTTTSDGKGFQYYQYTYKDVTPGQQIETQISYTKNDTRPSIQPKPDAPTQVANRTGEGRSQAPLIVAIVMGGLIAVGLGMYWIRTSAARFHPQTRQAHRRNASGNRKQRFCPSCGQKVQPQQRFCGNCGEKLS